MHSDTRPRETRREFYLKWHCSCSVLICRGLSRLVRTSSVISVCKSLPQQQIREAQQIALSGMDER